MKIKAYHATTPEAAERILVEGFKIPKESEEFYQGRGVYFAAGQEALDIVKRHGQVVLEVELDTDDFLDNNGAEVVGTWSDFLDGRHLSKHLESQLWKEYQDVAEAYRKDVVESGGKGLMRGSLSQWMEFVISDPETAKNLKAVRTEYLGTRVKTRVVTMRRPVRVRGHRRWA